MTAARASRLRRLLRRLRPSRRLTFTREGKYFTALCLGIGLAAINTGNNLLFLVLGLMLALIVGSGVLSEISLRRLTISRHIPERIFAGQPFLMGIGLANGKGRLSSFSIEVEDRIAGRSLEKRCYFLKVPAAQEQRTAYRHLFPRRGLYRLSGLALSTKFPFGLFRKSREVTAPAEVVVFPAIHPVLPPAMPAAESGEESIGRLSRRGDFHSLREYQSGDDPRSIHWRKTARLGRPMVRLNEEPTGRRVALFFDNRRSGPASPDATEQEERAVSQAASLAAHYLGQGYLLQLVTRTSGLAPGSGQAHLTLVLRTLALLEFTDADRPYVAPARWTGECVFVAPAPTAAPLGEARR